MGVSTAIVGGAAITGGMGLAGSFIGADASQSAAETMADANLSGQQLQYQMWQQQQANMQPWLKAGTAGVNSLAYGLGLSDTGGATGATGPVSQQGGLLNIPKFSFDPARIESNPDYQWVTKQGENALASQAAAAGNYGSGNMGTALVDYGQGAATQYMNQYYNQALDTYQQNLNSQYTMPYNMLSGISGTGQNQSQALGQMGLQAANTMGQYGVGAGAATAAGTLGAANAYTAPLNSMVASMPGYMNWYSQYGGGNTMNTPGYSGNIVGSNAWNPSNYSLLSSSEARSWHTILSLTR